MSLMHGPFPRIPDERRGRWVRLFLIATLVVYAGLFVIEVHTFTEAAPLGQISLQLAGTTEKVIEIVESWEETDALHMAGASLGFDYLLLVTYGIGLAVAGMWIEARGRAGRHRLMAWLGVAAAWAGLGAAALDAFENARLLRMIGDPASGDPQLVLVLAIIKFCLIGFAVVTWLAGAVVTRRPSRA